MQNVFIINFNSLYEILDEIKENLSFKIIKIKNEEDLRNNLDLDKIDFLVISKTDYKLLLNNNITDKNFLDKAKLIQDRITFFNEVAEMCSYFYAEPEVTVELLANKKQKVKEEDLPKIFEVLITTLEGITNWTEEELKTKLFEAADKNDLKRGQLLWPMRAALTGLPYSPGAFEVAGVLGREKVMERLRKSSNML